MDRFALSLRAALSLLLAAPAAEATAAMGQDAQATSPTVAASAPLPAVDYARVARDLARQAAHRAAAEADAEVRGRPHLRADCAPCVES